MLVTLYVFVPFLDLLLFFCSAAFFGQQLKEYNGRHDHTTGSGFYAIFFPRSDIWIRFARRSPVVCPPVKVLSKVKIELTRSKSHYIFTPNYMNNFCTPSEVVHPLGAFFQGLFFSGDVVSWICSIEVAFLIDFFHPEVGRGLVKR